MEWSEAVHLSVWDACLAGSFLCGEHALRTARREMTGRIYLRRLMEAIEQPLAGIRTNSTPLGLREPAALLAKYDVNNHFSRVLLKSPASGIIRVFVRCVTFFDIVWKHTPWKHVVKAINYHVNMSFYSDGEKCRATRYFASRILSHCAA